MNDRSEQISRLLNEQGYSVTPGRRIVVDAIAGRQSIFTANDVLGWVDAVDASIGRATIFRTLDLLSQVGVLNRIHGDDGCHSYTVCDTSHHHHLVCTNCGKVIAFESTSVEHESNEVAREHGFAVQSHRVEIFGLCQGCQQALRGGARAPEPGLHVVE